MWKVNCYTVLANEQVKYTIHLKQNLKLYWTIFKKGWPKSKNDIPNLIWNLFIHQQDLTCSNGIIFKGVDMVVAKSFCEGMKYLLHVDI